jgi:aspartokinase
MSVATEGMSRVAGAMKKAEEDSAKAITVLSAAYDVTQQIREKHATENQPEMTEGQKNAFETIETVFNLTTQWNSARLELATACERDVAARMNSGGDVGEAFDALSERNIAAYDVRASRSKLKRVESKFKVIGWSFIHLELQPHLKGRPK